MMKKDGGQKSFAIRLPQAFSPSATLHKPPAPGSFFLVPNAKEC